VSLGVHVGYSGPDGRLQMISASDRSNSVVDRGILRSLWSSYRNVSVDDRASRAKNSQSYTSTSGG